MTMSFSVFFCSGVLKGHLTYFREREREKVYLKGINKVVEMERKIWRKDKTKRHSTPNFFSLWRWAVKVCLTSTNTPRGHAKSRMVPSQWFPQEPGQATGLPSVLLCAENSTQATLGIRPVSFKTNANWSLFPLKQWNWTQTLITSLIVMIIYKRQISMTQFRICEFQAIFHVLLSQQEVFQFTVLVE